MKLNTAPANAVEMSGVASTNQFTIRASAKAFAVLSDGLYANKIRAIVRELSTNALDSHVAAGKAHVPFTVNIPNMLAPWFSVRDYGVGLNHNEVVNIYTSYFTSTKSDSDDFVGALGLGSKSPFSYTDNFTVTAIKDGRKGLYSAYIDDTGVPAIALMSESDTDEPTGVEVRFSVEDRNDFWRFVNEAASVYRLFAVKPEITGEAIEIESVDYFKKDLIPGVHIRNGYRGKHNVAVMGSIEYPIKLSQGVLDSDIKHIDGQNLEIHLPIGAVEMAASREELSYTAHTVEAIKTVYRKIADAVDQVFEEDIAKIDNVWERAHYMLDHYSNNLFRRAVLNHAKNNPNPLINIDKSYLNINDIEFAEQRAEELNIKLHCIDSGHGSAPTRGSRTVSRYNAKGEIEYFKAYAIPAGTEHVMFVKGTGTAPVSRVKTWARERRENKRIILAAPIDRRLPMLWDKFVEEIHCPPARLFKDIESFPKPERKARATATPVYEFVLERQGYNDHKAVQRPAGNLEDIDTEHNDVAYVKLYKHETHVNDKPFDLRSAMERLHSAGLLRGKRLQVFGVRKSELAEVQQTAGWVPFDQAVSNIVNNFSQSEFAAMYMKTIDSNWQRLYSKTEAKTLLKDSPAMSIADLFNEQCFYRLYDVKLLIEQFGNDTVKQRLKDGIAQVDAVIKQYPLVDHLNGYVDLSYIADYVKLIDNAKGEKACTHI
jgi:hypothetical protein